MSIRVTWLGHSCFRVEAHGFSVILDPFEHGSVPGFADLNETANMVLCSHDHFDHNAKAVVHPAEENAQNPFTVTTLSSFHDDQNGTLRGKNTITVLECDGVRIAHMGDIGCMPGELALERLQGVSLLLMPVGGHYTVDADAAFEIVQRVQPRAVVPMHYRSEHFGFEVLATIEPFAAKFAEQTRLPTNTVDVTADAPAGLVVLTYGGAEEKN